MTNLFIIKSSHCSKKRRRNIFVSYNNLLWTRNTTSLTVATSIAMSEQCIPHVIVSRSPSLLNTVCKLNSNLIDKWPSERRLSSQIAIIMFSDINQPIPLTVVEGDNSKRDNFKNQLIWLSLLDECQTDCSFFLTAITSRTLRFFSFFCYRRLANIVGCMRASLVGMTSYISGQHHIKLRSHAIHACHLACHTAKSRCIR